MEPGLQEALNTTQLALMQVFMSQHLFIVITIQEHQLELRMDPVSLMKDVSLL